VVVLAGSNNPKMYDLSFMYTKRCDLTCPFCMYNSGPDVNDRLDLQALRNWLTTVDMSRIASFGAYGGEPAVDLWGWSRIFDMLPEGKPRFVITNGTWSTDEERMKEFLTFCARYGLYVVVSGTAFHRRFQNRAVLEDLQRQQPEAIRLKPLEEKFYPMGRLEGLTQFTCSVKCMSWEKALRIAVQPDGTVLFQNCDGVFPVVGSITEAFSVLDSQIQLLRADGFSFVCPYYEEAQCQSLRS
jgi:hypothetical protein